VPNLFVNRLAQLAPLSSAALRTLDKIRVQTIQVGPDQDIVREGERPVSCRILVEGFACRYKLLAEGKRQITAFVIPGDLGDLHSFVAGRMDHIVSSLNTCTVAVIPDGILGDLAADHPSIANALWRHSVIEAAIAREWVANVGRRSAYQRLAHLLSEVFTRLNSLGLCSDNGFEWPVTQSELADATGLSTVHCNRVLRELRIAGLVTVAGSKVTIEDWDGLRRAGEFDPSYLAAA